MFMLCHGGGVFQKESFMICFIHIERAGGTTLHYIFRNNFLSYITLTPWHYWSNEEQNVFSTKEAKWLLKLLPFLKGFGGHTTRAYLGYEKLYNPKIDYITFLREPISRYLSHYNYQKKVMGIDWKFEEFLNEKRFDNFMTKRIAGVPDVKTAIKYLNDKFSFVGLNEKFDESILIMKTELKMPNFKPFYERKNVSINLHYSESDLFQEKHMKEKIIKRNELDIKLYEHVRAELFPIYIERGGAKLQNELNYFKKANSDFKFSRIRWFICAIYRWMFYRNLEYFLFRTFHRNELRNDARNV